MFTSACLAEQNGPGLPLQSTVRMERKKTMKDCTVCLVPHDDEIHAATLNVRSWFHEQVTQGFYDDAQDVVIAPAADPATVAVA